MAAASPRAGRRPAPLDQAGLERLALRYVERFATSRARLLDYLARKLRERGWAGADAPDAVAIADRFVALGYIDDAAFGAARARALTRRGLGARRVAQALGAAGLTAEVRAPLVSEAQAEAQALATALAFAKRRRFGPFGAQTLDPAARQRQFAAFLRAGHAPDVVAKILKMNEDEVSNFLDVNYP
ncbi:MAG: hypothetical protein A4S12_14010 [Proteobacteria bacterium SG_bin5]|nr:RecX family transcriptional regulator [Sphingomonas sp.]OQW42529.1 MAG: hypothetical protein A4S12_14010 [Proteobacteria bacterium SG_bin5]